MHYDEGDGRTDAVCQRDVYKRQDVDRIKRQDWPEAVVTYMKELCARIGIGASLKPYGVKPEDLDDLTDSAMEVKRLLLKNPKVLSREEIRAIYQGLLE